MIVKIQRPIWGNMTQALVYNKSRSIMELMPIKIANKAFRRSKKVKGFFYATLKKTILHIGPTAPWQKW